MAALGVTRALIEAGGDIVVGDAPPGREGWRIASLTPTPHSRCGHAAHARGGRDVRSVGPIRGDR